MVIEMSLLEVLAYKMNCLYLSDLRFLSAAQRLDLARKLSAIPPYAASISEWNDALCYFGGTGKEGTENDAKERLLNILLNEGDEKVHAE